ncbi:unnamed protein product [Allacma fusca]|uniref:Uncharacterized protein n=1 Tax=Allacma fusca TaxID=39272 RepID=A0A8J2PHV7_9HEXA|nr:unnamed protein product [Allacma fusca]
MELRLNLPLSYPYKRSTWSVSPPGSKLSKKIGYVLYSAMGSFYIPSCIMVFVYIRIYYAARDRARRAVRKPPRPKPQSSTIDCDDSKTTTTNFSGRSTSPKPPQSAPPHLVTSPVEINAVPPNPTSPMTESSRTVKQVGFQEPLVRDSSCEKPLSKPEITVEGCSPEDSMEENCESKEEKVVQVTVEDIHSETETDHTSSNNGVTTEAGISNKSRRRTSKGSKGKETSESDNLSERKGDGQSSVSQTGSKSKRSRSVKETKESKDKTTGFQDPMERVAHHSALAVSELENTITELQTNGGSRSDESSTTVATNTTSAGPPESRRTSKRPKLHFLRVETPTIWRTSSSLSLNGDVHILEADPVSDVEPSSSDSGAISRCAVVKPLKLRLCQPFFGKKFGTSSSSSGKARRDALDMGKLNSPKEIRDPEREKRRIARKKEKRATLILGLIMGSFILCWLPFFFLYIFEPLCNCNVASWGFAIAFWLGEGELAGSGYVTVGREYNPNVGTSYLDTSPIVMRSSPTLRVVT